MTLHKSGNLGELNHNHLTTFGRKVMKRHLKIIGPFETIISKVKLFILTGIIAFNYNCEDASTADDNNSSNLLFIASEGNFGQNNGSISVFNKDKKIQNYCLMLILVMSMMHKKRPQKTGPFLTLGRES